MTPNPPTPADPTLPPPWLLFALFFLGMAFVFAYLFVEAALRARKRRRIDTIKVVAECLAQFKNGLEHWDRERLINQSPGGRKPWQQ